MAIITCPECGGKISDTLKQCIHCGVKISVCPECGVISTGDIEFCPECGYALKKKAMTDGGKGLQCNSAKDVIREWKKRNPLSGLLYNNYAWFALIGICALLLIIAAVRLVLWNNALEYKECFSSIKTLLVFSAIFYVLQSVFSSIGEYYQVVLLSTWCVGNKLNMVSIIETTMKMNFDALTLEEAGEELGGTQWCVKAAAYSEDFSLRSKEKTFRIIKVGLGVVAVILLCIFLINNVEIYMQAELLKSDMLGIEGFSFSMIENWWLLVVSVILFIAEKIVNNRNDNNDEKISDAWVSKNLPDHINTYAKYAKAESFSEYILRRSEQASK